MKIAARSAESFVVQKSEACLRIIVRDLEDLDGTQPGDQQMRAEMSDAAAVQKIDGLTFGKC